MGVSLNLLRHAFLSIVTTDEPSNSLLPINLASVYLN